MGKIRENHYLNRGLMVGGCIALAMLGVALAIKIQDLPQVADAPVASKTASSWPQAVYTATPELTEFVLGNPTIIPESIRGATIDMGADGSNGAHKVNDIQVVFYDLGVTPVSHFDNGFRVYNGSGHLIYEDDSSLWKPVPVAWGDAQPVDLDGNGQPELLVTGTADGTGAYTIQEVFGWGGHVPFGQFEVTQSKTDDELATEFLHSGEGLGDSNTIIDENGIGHRQICGPGPCQSRQTVPNSPGEITNTYIYKSGVFTAVNYTRHDY